MLTYHKSYATHRRIVHWVWTIINFQLSLYSGHSQELWRCKSEELQAVPISFFGPPAEILETFTLKSIAFSWESPTYDSHLFSRKRKKCCGFWPRDVQIGHYGFRCCSKLARVSNKDVIWSIFKRFKRRRWILTFICIWRNVDRLLILILSANTKIYMLFWNTCYLWTSPVWAFLFKTMQRCSSY